MAKLRTLDNPLSRVTTLTTTLPEIRITLVAKNRQENDTWQPIIDNQGNAIYLAAGCCRYLLGGLLVVKKTRTMANMSRVTASFRKENQMHLIYAAGSSSFHIYDIYTFMNDQNTSLQHKK